jgi:LacI family transcriptional regulator
VSLALDHLAGLGHRRVVHVAGPPGLEAVDRRAAAFARHAARLGLELAEVISADLFEEGGRLGAGAALAEWPEATALFTTTVSQGVGALHALWEWGLRVPADVSLVAHADMPLAGYLVPPLTAVQMPLAELGAAGVDALVEQIQTGTTRDVVVVAGPSLVLRDSTAPPRGGPLSAR